MSTVTAFAVAGDPCDFGPIMRRLSIVCDFSLTNSGAGDTVNLWTIPAGTVIHAVTAQVVTAEGGTLTFDVGDTQGAGDDYIDGADGNAAAWLTGDGSTGGTPTTIVTSHYTAAATLTMTTVNAADAAKIIVHVDYSVPTGAPTQA